jgi:PIN domain nuclease of toxin-antitoxin system
MAAVAAKFPRKVQALLDDPENDLLVSSASILEIAVKDAIGKIRMPEAFVRQAIDDLGLTIMPFEARHAYRLFSLPLHHRDPFDRMIIATALAENVPLAGGDQEFANYKELRRIW